MQYGMKNGSVVSLWHRAVTHSHRGINTKIYGRTGIRISFLSCTRTKLIRSESWMGMHFSPNFPPTFFCLSLFKWTSNASINVLDSSYRSEKQNSFIRFNAMHFTHTQIIIIIFDAFLGNPTHCQNVISNATGQAILISWFFIYNGLKALLKIQ